MANHVVIMVFITSHLPIGVSNPSVTFSAGSWIAGNEEAKKPSPKALPKAPPNTLAAATAMHITSIANDLGLPSIFDTSSATPSQILTHI